MKKFVLGLFLFGMFQSTQAVVIGNLSTDSSSDYIIDTVTGRQYVRFDEFDLSYADTLAAVATGGAYEGFSIATSTINNDFINAMFGTSSNVCTDTPNIQGEYCGQITGWSDELFGASYNAYYDFYAYISTEDTFTTGGILLAYQIGLTQIHYSGHVTEYDDWGQNYHLDNQNLVSNSSINLLLYRDVSVPEPSSLLLMGLGLAGLGFIRKRKA